MLDVIDVDADIESPASPVSLPQARPPVQDVIDLDDSSGLDDNDPELPSVILTPRTRATYAARRAARSTSTQDIPDISANMSGASHGPPPTHLEDIDSWRRSLQKVAFQLPEPTILMIRGSDAVTVGRYILALLELHYRRTRIPGAGLADFQGISVGVRPSEYDLIPQLFLLPSMRRTFSLYVSA